MPDLEHDIQINPTSILNLGSLSKQFVTMCILLMEERSKISLAMKFRIIATQLSKLMTIYLLDVILFTLPNVLKTSGYFHNVNLPTQSILSSKTVIMCTTLNIRIVLAMT